MALSHYDSDKNIPLAVSQVPLIRRAMLENMMFEASFAVLRKAVIMIIERY